MINHDSYTAIIPIWNNHAIICGENFPETMMNRFPFPSVQFSIGFLDLKNSNLKNSTFLGGPSIDKNLPGEDNARVIF